MRRIVRSACLISCIAAGSTPVLIAADARAQSQPLLDPGWQIGYPVAAQNGGPVMVDGGVLQYMFAGGGQVMVQRPYQPAPIYYQSMAAPQARGYAAAPVYYQMVTAPQRRGYQTAPVYYQVMAAPQARAVPPAPAYYPPQVSQAPQAPQPRGLFAALQARTHRQAPVYYQAQAQTPVQRGYPVAPAYYQAAPVPQPSVAPAPLVSYQAPSAPQQAYFPGLPVSIHPIPAPQPGAGQPAPNQQVARATQPDAGPVYDPQPPADPAPQLNMARLDVAPTYAQAPFNDMLHPMIDPKYDRQIVDYQTEQEPGTLVIDTPHFFLYLVLGGGKALRYGIGVGRPGFTWAGMKEVSALREWPDWYPPDDMLKRRPDLPKYMAGGPNNPLGARAIYLGSTLYRIHGSNEPWTIGTQVSSGCIRLRNEDVVDLYGRVKLGAKVLVI